MSGFVQTAISGAGRAFARIKLLTPSSLWEGIGLGLIALAAGGAAMLFHSLTTWIELHTVVRLALAGRAWFVGGSLASVLIGSTLACWIIARFAPSAGGGGVLPVKLAFWKGFGVMEAREGAVKLVGSALTLGSGVSMGPEGPSLQIGAATMSAIAGSAGVAKQARRAWCAAGAAAGLAAVFNAPLAAITFILEEIIGDLNSRLLGKVVVAAVIGALVGHAVLGPQPAFQTSPLGVIGWRAWALVPFIALAAALSGSWFQKASLVLRGRLIKSTPAALQPYRPVLGAAISWAAGIGAFLYSGHIGIFGVGYHDITEAIAGRLTCATALVLLLCKIVATAGAVGSNGCGGIFAPSLFIGAMAGAGFGSLASLVISLSGADLSMLVMVGMAASLGAVIRTPLTCVLLIFEVTNQWVVVPALMLAAVVSETVARLVNTHDMYDQMLIQNGVDPNQVLPPRHFKRWREIPVSALASFKPVVVRSLAAEDLKRALEASAYLRYPVAGPDGRIRAVLARREAEIAVLGGGEPRLEPVHWISPRASVGQSRKMMLGDGVDFLCVGDSENGEIQGILTLHDILRGQSSLEEDSEI